MLRSCFERVYVSRHVVFNKCCFSFHLLSKSEVSQSSPVSSKSNVLVPCAVPIM